MEQLSTIRPEGSRSDALGHLFCLLQVPESEPRTLRYLEDHACTLDWDDVLRLACAHRVRPLLYRALHGECLRLVPDRVFVELEVHCRSNAARNMLMAAELLDIISCLQRKGVEAVPFKGPVSAVSAHGSLAYREFGDLDVLVRRQDFTDALSVLRDSGYRLDPGIGDLEDHLSRMHEVRLGKKTLAGLAILLELHWRLAPGFEGMQVTSDELITETASLELLDQEVVVLRPELELLVTCVGGAKTCWQHMEGACVVSALICGDRIRDWGFLRRKASGFGLTRALNLGLGLGECLSESSSSSVDTTGEQAGQLIAALRDRVLQSWAAPGEKWPVSDWPRFQLKVRERGRDRLRYLEHWWLTLGRPHRRLGAPLGFLDLLCQPLAVARLLWLFGRILRERGRPPR